jgi:hypothetical protein
MRVGALIVAFAWFAVSAPARSAACNSNHRSESDLDISLSNPPRSVDTRFLPETYDVGGGIVLDEHLLMEGRRDRDYNGGGEITFFGASALKYGSWLDPPLQYFDERLDIDRSSDSNEWRAAHALAAGLLVFTPGDHGKSWRAIVRTPAFSS